MNVYAKLIQSIFVTCAGNICVSGSYWFTSELAFAKVQSLKSLKSVHIPVEFMPALPALRLAQLRHHVVDDITTPQMGNSWAFILEQSVIIMIQRVHKTKHHVLSFERSHVVWFRVDIKDQNDFNKLEGGSKHKFVTWSSDVSWVERSSTGWHNSIIEGGALAVNGEQSLARLIKSPPRLLLAILYPWPLDRAPTTDSIL